MNYIAEDLNNLLNVKKPNLVFPSSQSTQVQDPLSKLIKWLDIEKGVEIKIKNEEEVLIEDFLYTENNKTI